MEEEEEGGEELGEEEDIRPEEPLFPLPTVAAEKDLAPQAQDQDVQLDDRKSFSESILDVACSLRKPEDNFIGPIFNCYYPSSQTHKLSSERYRLTFAEAFCTDETKRGEGEDVKYIAPKLVSLCLDALASIYVKGNFNVLKIPHLREQFGKRLSIKLPLVDIVNLDIISYWQKVYFEMCPDMLLTWQKKVSTNEDWKSLGIQEKFRDLIESSKYEEWHETAMKNLAKSLSKYITTLIIRHLQPLQEFSVERDPNLVNYKIRKTPFEDCHHINLDIVGELKNLTYLHIEFQGPLVGYNYDGRFFKFSYTDMENLARGLRELSKLKKFTLRRSLMNNRKLITLTNAMYALNNLESLDFSYCELKDDTGWTLTQLLDANTKIKSLELEGNHLGALGMYSLMFGVQNYRGFFEYFGLARNPILDEGVMAIARALHNCKQVTHLNITGAIMSEFGAGLVAEFIKYATTLLKLEMCALPLGEEGGDRLVRSLRKNETLLELDCRACDISPHQQYHINLLLKRNNYIKMTAPVTAVIAKTPEERNKLQKEMDEWVAAPKHPTLIKAQESFKKTKECVKKSFAEEEDDLASNIPIFIPKSACKEISNKELLHGEYYEEDRESFEYDPNNFTEEEIFEHCDTGW